MAEYNRLLSKRVAAYASEINQLKALVTKLQRMQFGKSSEKLRGKTQLQVREAEDRINALQEELAETLGRWSGAVSELLEPLYDLLREYVLMPDMVHTDDIPVPVQAPGSGKTRTGRLWIYVRDDHNAGSGMPPAVWFAYSPDRKGLHPQQHLAGYSGILPGAYGGYNALYENGRITEAACMAHARRKIHDVHARTPTDITTEALRRIGELYAIEAEIRSSPAEKRLSVREVKTVPRMQSLYNWLQTQMKTLSRHAEIAKAFAYLLKQWNALNLYCENGWAEIDNNIAESVLRYCTV